MPWGWAPRHEARAQSHAEPSSTKPWKEHEGQVLKRLLKSNTGRFNMDNVTDPLHKFIYLQQQAQAGIEAEVEADLVHGFRAWLQGTHEENRPGRTDKYQNTPDGRPHRRKMDGRKYDHVQTEWQSTPWGDAQLTHLPGVREWLRENAIATDKADLEMQLLAEYGPHDLETAWKYYKHWVLKRPISYPHAYNKDEQAGNGGHGPGLIGPYNADGWYPRRSTHFDALPPRKPDLPEFVARLRTPPSYVSPPSYVPFPPASPPPAGVAETPLTLASVIESVIGTPPSSPAPTPPNIAASSGGSFSSRPSSPIPSRGGVRVAPAYSPYSPNTPMPSVPEEGLASEPIAIAPAFAALSPFRLPRFGEQALSEGRAQPRRSERPPVPVKPFPLLG